MNYLEMINDMEKDKLPTEQDKQGAGKKKKRKRIEKKRELLYSVASK